MPTQLECDVLIVGAGPTGATLALLLARRGVSTLLIDKEADIYPLPRAAHVDHEIMRIFQELGVAAEIEAACRQAPRYDFLNAEGEILLRFEGGDRIGPGGWRASNMVHQPSIEATLRRAIAGRSDISFKTSWRFVSCEESEVAVSSTLETPDGVAIVRSSYVVGADGARSRVRESTGIAFDDLQFDEPWLVIDAIVHDPTRLPDINLQICDPARPTTCVLMGAGRHRWANLGRRDDTLATARMGDHSGRSRFREQPPTKSSPSPLIDRGDKRRDRADCHLHAIRARSERVEVASFELSALAPWFGRETGCSSDSCVWSTHASTHSPPCLHSETDGSAESQGTVTGLKAPHSGRSPPPRRPARVRRLLPLRL